MEIGQAVLPLYFIHPQLDFTKRMILIFLEIRKRDLENATFQSIIRILKTGCPIDEGFANAVDVSVCSSIFRDKSVLSDLEG